MGAEPDAGYAKTRTVNILVRHSITILWSEPTRIVT